jgi:Tol biopolymer transport system component
MGNDGSDLTPLTSSAGSNLGPAWSADGRRLAFVSSRTTNADVYVINADGSGETQLTTDPAYDAEPSWSPDGRIAFTSSRSGDLRIWTMDGDGSDEAVLPAPSGESQLHPAWSPDGGRIAFVFYSADGVGLAVMNADGSGRRNLVQWPPPDRSNFHEPRRPTWSPDGGRIAFELTSGGGGAIFYTIEVVNAAGGGVITAGPGTSTFQPAWSPDGRYMIFRDDDALYLMDGESYAAGGLTRIFLTENAHDPDWQPLVPTPPEPQPADYKNRSRYCKALRDFLGDAAFAERFGGGGHGACVSAG